MITKQLPGVVELSRQLDEGVSTAEQLTRDYLARIHALNPQLNAFISVTADSALAQAQQSDARIRCGQRRSMLDGIPLALKDNIAYTGAPVSNGVGALRERRVDADAEVTRRLLEAGAVILGKLNMDEAALGATTNNPHFGRCDNPRIPGDTPGGSSGGSAAAVAAGLCAAALGSDTLGSVRIPAAYCGVTGFLPGRGLVSRCGLGFLSVSLDQIGVLVHTTADATAVFDVLCGYDPADEQSDSGADAMAPLQVASDDETLRILPIDCAASFDSDDAGEISAGIDRVSAILRRNGHRIETPATPPTSFTRLRRDALLVIEAEGFVACEPWLDQPGVSAALGKFLRYGAGQPASAIEQARARLRAARLAWRALLQQHDFILLPTAPQCSFPYHQPVPPGQADFTSVASVAGLPAISLPCGIGRQRRFLSAQIVGAAGSEARLMALAGQLERSLHEQ